jgi:hypothetical protein
MVGARVINAKVYIFPETAPMEFVPETAIRSSQLFLGLFRRPQREAVAGLDHGDLFQVPIWLTFNTGLDCGNMNAASFRLPDRPFIL